MLRRIAFLLGFAVASCVTGACQPPAQAVAYLGEMVPELMISISNPIVDIAIQDVPAESLIWSSPHGDVSYGVLPIGQGTDASVSFAVLENGLLPPQLLIDENNNEDLDDERWRGFDLRVDARKFKWSVTIDVEFSDAVTSSVGPYHIGMYAEYSYEFGRYVYSYVNLSYRRGVLVVGDSLYGIQIATPTSTGRYDDVEKLVIAVDVDKNGVIDALPYSHEAFAPGELIELPEGTYRVSSCRVDGQFMTLERTGDSKPRPVIATGELAPAISATGFDGSVITIPDARYTATVLYFLPAVVREEDCTVCASGDPVDDLADLYQSIYYTGPDVRMIAISYSPIPADFELELPGQLAVGRPASSVVAFAVHDPAINELYRRNRWTFVLDREGRIVAMDEGWSAQREDRTFGGTSRLRRYSLPFIIERIIQQNGD